MPSSNRCSRHHTEGFYRVGFTGIHHNGNFTCGVSEILDGDRSRCWICCVRNTAHRLDVAPNSSSYTVTRAAGSSFEHRFSSDGTARKSRTARVVDCLIDNPARVSTNDPPAPRQALTIVL